MKIPAASPRASGEKGWRSGLCIFREVHSQRRGRAEFHRLLSIRPLLALGHPS
jgi:hypothetical protein